MAGAPSSTKQKFLKEVELQDISVSLQTYAAESIQVVWTMQVQIKHGGYAGELKLYGTAQRQLDTHTHAAA